MRMIDASEREVTITVSLDDLDFLRQGMREMLQALSDKEVKARTGNTSEHASTLMRDIRAVLDAADSRH